MCCDKTEPESSGNHTDDILLPRWNGDRTDDTPPTPTMSLVSLMARCSGPEGATRSTYYPSLPVVLPYITMASSTLLPGMQVRADIPQQTLFGILTEAIDLANEVVYNANPLLTDEASVVSLHGNGHGRCGSSRSSSNKKGNNHLDQ